MRNYFLNLIIILFIVIPTIPAYCDLKISGSSTIMPIIKEAAKSYETINGDSFHIIGGGSDYGIQSVKNGTVDIGMVSRKLTRDESIGFKIFLIGYDGIGIIINKAIPLDNISKIQVIDIFSGITFNWNSISEINLPITVVAKKHGRATRKLFDNFFLLPKTVSTALLIGSNTEAIILVSGDPGAIGYVSIGSAEYAVDKGLELKILSLDSIAASSKTVSDGSYPFRRELNLIVKNDASQKSINFISFILSLKGQSLVKKHHFVPLELE